MYNLTYSFSDKSIESLIKIDSLKEKWKLCYEKCSSCFYRWAKILGHLKEHDCGLDHVCHEKCQICDEIKCKDFDNWIIFDIIKNQDTQKNINVSIFINVKGNILIKV